MVSIVIASYNHIDYIEHTLKSLAKQSYSNIEIIVIDDGSTDGSIEFLNRLRIEYYFR